MRLVVLGPGHPFRGGIATTTTALVEGLRARGHEVLFLTPRRQYPRWLYPGAGGGRDAAACPPVEGARAVLDPLNPLAWRRGRRAAVAAVADAWLMPYWTWAWAGWWRYLLGGRRPPAVAVVHNPVDHDAGRVQKAAAHAVLSRCQALFTHARALARALRGRFPGTPVASHPLPATSRLELPDKAAARRGLGVPEGGRLAVFVGLIRPYKGVDLLLEAFSRVSAGSPWFLLVAGEAWGGLGDALRHRATSADLEGRVALELRWLEEERLAAALAAADLVILPYRGGSQSAMAPLALAHGVPVLTTEVGGLAEVVHHEVSGLVVPPGSAEALTEALESLDCQRLEALAAGALRTGSSLTWSGYVRALEELIESVVD
jgi:glycosyltransferase involved in cell wall biosynthesis